MAPQAIRDILRSAEVAISWKYANWLIALFLALAAIMLAVEKFASAVLIVGASLVWSLVLWWRSEYSKRTVKLSRHKWGKTPARSLQVSGAILIFFVYAIPMSSIRDYAEHRELEQLEGRLFPANDSDPPNSCSFEISAGNGTGRTIKLMPDGALKVFLGKIMVSYSIFPHKIFTVNQKNPLVLNRDESGRIALTMDIFDKDGKIVVRFEDGHFTVNQNARLDMKRPDRSTLIVRDNYGNEVLNIRYLNERAVVIAAILQYSQAKPITIEKTRFADLCLGDVGSVGVNFDSPK